jgi:hypothetical protein
MLSGCLVPYLSSKQSACALLYCHVWPICLYHIFPHFLINGAISWKKLLNVKCVFWFSVQIPSETFLSLRRVQRDVAINVQHLHAKYLFLRPNCKENRLSSPDFRKKFNMKFHENLSTGRCVIPCGRTEWRTWRS